jgi:FlaA1/EpsC-like NDP-sugar epimerase
MGLEDALADEGRYESIVIWGAGRQTEKLFRASHFLKVVKVAFLVDNTPDKVGGTFNGLDVVAPDELLKSDLPVLVSAVQASPKILEEFYGLGLDESRLIRSLVI